MKEDLIAPCGMNCSLCIAYIFSKNNLNKKGFHKKYCLGCIPRGKNCTFSLANHCELIKNGKIRYCFECHNYPCKYLKNLDKRYKTKYNMSIIDNLNNIKNNGVNKFLLNETKKWQCQDCGELICCHSNSCLNCHIDDLKKKR